MLRAHDLPCTHTLSVSLSPDSSVTRTLANPSLTKVSVAPGGRDVVVYTTISGAVGALIPFVSNDDVEFMTTLEMVSCFGVRMDLS